MRSTCTTNRIALIREKEDRIMDLAAATALGKLIGAGIAVIALGGVGSGIGNIFASYVSGALRNPAAAPKVFGNVLLGFALVEAVALYALVIAMLLLFVF